jgi:hypothetical protein
VVAGAARDARQGEPGDALEAHELGRREPHGLRDRGRRQAARDHIPQVVEHQRHLRRGDRLLALGELCRHETGEDIVLERHPRHEHEERRDGAPHRRQQPIVAGQRVEVAHLAVAADHSDGARLADLEGQHRERDDQQ